MSISRALRYQVLRRDNHACRYCGATAPDVKLTVDHVTPTALGGSDEPANLVTACSACNGGKAATPPDAAQVEDVNAAALHWAAAMRIASETIAADRLSRDSIRADFLEAWQDWTYAGSDGERHTIELPNSWPNSIDSLVKAGLGVADIVDAVDIAMRAERVKETFRYFCGVAWSMVRELQELTHEVLTTPTEAPQSNFEGRTGRIRIQCTNCQEIHDVAIDVIADAPDELLRLRGTILPDDPWEAMALVYGGRPS